MPKLIINQDNSIEDVMPDDYGSGVFVSDISVISQSKYGHSVFDYIGGEIVLNQARYDSFELPSDKTSKVNEIKQYGAGLINKVIPGLNNLDTINLMTELWLSIAPAARNATVNFQYAIDVRQAAKDAIIVVNAMSDSSSVNSYDVINTPSWPVSP